MDDASTRDRAGLLVAIGALAGILIGLAALLDIWPFAEDELSEAEFIAQGNEICRQAHQEFLSLQDRPVRTPSDAAELTEALIEVADEERDAIADLNGPSSLDDAVGRYLDVRDKGIGLLRDARKAAEDADAQEYERIQAELAATQLDPRYAIAQGVGFSECSKPLIARDRLRRDAEPPAPTDSAAPPTVSNPPTGAQ